MKNDRVNLWSSSVVAPKINISVTIFQKNWRQIVGFPQPAHRSNNAPYWDPTDIKKWATALAARDTTPRAVFLEKSREREHGLRYGHVPDPFLTLRKLMHQIFANQRRLKHATK